MVVVLSIIFVFKGRINSKRMFEGILVCSLMKFLSWFLGQLPGMAQPMPGVFPGMFPFGGTQVFRYNLSFIDFPNFRKEEGG